MRSFSLECKAKPRRERMLALDQRTRTPVVHHAELHHHKIKRYKAKQNLVSQKI